MQISKRHVFWLIATVCACFAIVGCTSPFSSESSADTVLATVGDTKITQAQVDSLAAESVKNTASSDKLSENRVKQNILCTLIKDEALTQDAQAHNITVSDDQVNAKIDETKHMFPSEEEFNKALAQEGLTVDLYKHHLRMNMITQQLEEQVRTPGDVTNDDLLNYIKAHNSQLVSRRSSHILFNASDEALARETLNRIKNGEDFGQLAKEYSQCPSKQQSGDLGWDCATTFVSSFQDALNKLDKGQVSDLVKTEFGWHIIKCTDIYRPTNLDQLTLDQVPTEIQQVARQRMTAQNRSAQFYQYTHNLLQTMADNKKIALTDAANMSTEDFLTWDESTNPVK